MLLGVDVGGTFTDAVMYDGRRLHTAKAPTTPADQSRGVIAAIDAVLERAGATATDVEVFAHGMTVGTNALLEERGARTALVATQGFADLLEIGRQNRPSLYHLCRPKPAPLSPAELRFEAPERVGPDGVIEPLAEDAVDAVVERIGRSGAEAVAICLLFSYLEPAHEAAIASRVRDALPGVHVSASHEVLPQFREYERCSTTVIDAYLSPLLDRYLGRLADTAARRGLAEPLVMQSSGGVAPAAEASRAGAWSVLSGPAGGAVGAGLLAAVSGDGNAIGIDMGGTSCDVSVVENGRVRRTDWREIEGRVLQLPMVDVHTVGAGGGSIGWRDAGGALRVGPRSAGAEPGPACYGRGGDEPAVTDANLLLGYLAEDSTLAGGVALDVDAARAAVRRLGEELGLGELETAEGIVRVANQEMIRALRVVTVERGVDPRGLALVAFGGAGPLHACALADALGMDAVIVPARAGVLSAVGILGAPMQVDLVRSVPDPLDHAGARQLSDELWHEARELLLQQLGAVLVQPEPTVTELDIPEAEGVRMSGISVAAPYWSLPSGEPLPPVQLDATFDCRYAGQSHELNVRSPLRFHREHRLRNGYERRDHPVEVVAVRARAWVESPVRMADLPPPERSGAVGPAVIAEPDCTIWVPEGWMAEPGAAGALVLRRVTQ
jgi:N-methylhydantoinase A